MNLFKKIGKGVKNIFSGIGRTFKKIVKSKLGKALLIGAAIFIGGAMLGAWQGPSWLGGAGGSGAGGASGAGTMSSMAPEVASAESFGLGASTGTLGQATAAGEAAAGGGSAAAGATDVLAGALPEFKTSMDLASAGAAASPAPGLISQASGISASMPASEAAASQFAADQAVHAAFNAGAAPAGASAGLLGKAGAWMQANPIPTLVAGNMIQGLAQPDPYEEWVKQNEYERRNANYAGVYGDGRTTDIQLPTSGLLSRAGRQQYNPRA